MKPCEFIIDTGAPCSIVKPHLVKNDFIQCSNEIRLKTATGELVPVVGKVIAKIKLGDEYFHHQFLVAEVEENCLLGLDFMRTQGFILDLKVGTLRQGDMESPVHYTNTTASVRREVATEDIIIPAQSEALVWAKTENCGKFKTVRIIEPLNSTIKHGLLIGKTLVQTEPKGFVPVRVMNVIECDKQLTKGEKIAVCSPVDHILA